MILKSRKKPTITYNIDSAPYINKLLTETGLDNTISEFATAQAAFETNGFTSSILKSNNNLFGMKYAGQITAQGEKNGYAYYLTIENSIIDFAEWYKRHRNALFSLPLYIFNLSGYVKFLKNNKYFEATENEYFKGCEYYYNLIYA
jgi:uncharacterized FlgJ-related protein